MNIRKAYAIYFSPTGTTQKAVTAFVDGMHIPFEKIDLTLPKTRRTFNRSFNKDELAVVGLPVYGGRLPRGLEDFFPGLKGDDAPAVALVTYGNREFDDALIELKVRLEERGFIAAAAAAFIGEHTFSSKIATGRPDIKDLATARSFGGQTAAALNKGISGKLTVKGNYPYVSKGFDPAGPANPGSLTAYANITTLDNCERCGLCAENCPWGAIDAADLKTINTAKCMRCFRCIKNCPANAKLVTDGNFLALVPQFEARLSSRRREPELFLPIWSEI
jgi:ferredoxin/flavodoxin